MVHPNTHTFWSLPSAPLTAAATCHPMFQEESMPSFEALAACVLDNSTPLPARNRGIFYLRTLGTEEACKVLQSGELTTALHVPSAPLSQFTSLSSSHLGS